MLVAFLVIVIDSDNHSIADFNGKMGTDSTKPYSAIDAASEYLKGVIGGTVNANVQIISRSTDPSVSTAGSGSASTSYTLK